MNWKDYEVYIYKYFKKLYPDAKIKYNVKKLGHISKTMRQIDIHIKGSIAGFDLNIAVDCKYFNKKINVKIVESFISFLHDIKANKGVLITNIGYSKTAYNRAMFDSQDIDLRIINFNELEKFQGFGCIAYAGKFCAIIPAPDGWVVDAYTPQRFNAMIYPIGLTFEEALGKDGFIYANFIKKNSEFPDLKSLLIKQEENIKNSYPSSKIEYKSTVRRKYGKTLLRIAKIHKGYLGPEYTIFVEFDDFIIFFVLLTPLAKAKNYLKKLEWIVKKFIPGTVTFKTKKTLKKI